VSETKDTEIRSKYDDFTAEELKEALKTVFFCSSHITDKELEEMEQIMSVLRRKAPLSDEYSGEELWERFQEVHGEELSSLGIRNTEEVMKEEAEAPSVEVPEVAEVKSVEASAPVRKRRCRKLLHTALIAAAVVAAMVIITVSAAAAGINIWKWVQVRGEGTVRFVTEDALSKDIPSALKQVGVEDPLFPTWIPEGFLLYDQEIRLDDPIRVYTTYVYKDRILMVNIRSVSNDSKSGLIEIEDEEPQEYLSGGIAHYIIPNCNELVAYWMNDGFLVKISGNLSIEEIEHIIDSVYDEEIR
jgi:hypothetical protein